MFHRGLTLVSNRKQFDIIGDHPTKAVILGHVYYHVCETEAIGLTIICEISSGKNIVAVCVARIGNDLNSLR